MADEAKPKWFQPGYKIPERQLTPGTPLWCLQKNHERLSCDLRDRGVAFGGVEIRTWRGAEFHLSHWFATRAQAEHYASVLRGDFERDGWRLEQTGADGDTLTASEGSDG